MFMQEFCQLLAQTFILLTLVAEHYRALEQAVLQLLRQLAPQIGRGRAENREIPGGDVVDDAIRVLTHAITIKGQCGDIGPNR